MTKKAENPTKAGLSTIASVRNTQLQLRTLVVRGHTLHQAALLLARTIHPVVEPIAALISAVEREASRR